MLANMAVSLILSKRINTTVAKAKALKKYIEPLVTKAKNDTTHSRRIVFSYLQDKEAVQILFSEIAEKVGSRPGGYTRIIKLGTRLGDAADMCMMELVDFNDLLIKEAKPATGKKRSRRGSKKKENVEATTEEVLETPVVEEKSTDTVESKEEVAEAPTGQATEEVEPVEAKEEPEESSTPEVKEDNSSEDESSDEASGEEEKK